MKRSMVAAVLAALALGLAGVPAGADNGATYEPPYDNGPSGGATINQIRRDPDGRVLVARLNPAPGPLNCPPGGPYAKFQVEHTLTGPVETVRAPYTEAAVDSYVFVVLEVRDPDGVHLARIAQRGPLFMDGELEVQLDPELFDEEDGLWVDDVLTIQFGLESASGCPQLNGGTVRFPEIEVS